MEVLRDMLLGTSHPRHRCYARLRQPASPTNVNSSNPTLWLIPKTFFISLTSNWPQKATTGHNHGFQHQRTLVTSRLSLRRQPRHGYRNSSRHPSSPGRIEINNTQSPMNCSTDSKLCYHT